MSTECEIHHSFFSSSPRGGTGRGHSQKDKPSEPRQPTYRIFSNVISRVRLKNLPYMRKALLSIIFPSCVKGFQLSAQDCIFRERLPCTRQPRLDFQVAYFLHIYINLSSILKVSIILHLKYISQVCYSLASSLYIAM